MELESPRRRSSSSPEFEFWMVGNNHPESEPNLHTADELFIDGVLQPLHLLAIHKSNTNSGPECVLPEPDPAPPPESSLFSSAPLIPSKRWTDIFKKKESEKEKKKERKTSSRSNNNNSGAAELNINIWPFSRSRSAGTAAAARPKAAMQKSSSAPCSRSNSRGDITGTGGRRWAPSPGRPGVGVPVGRSSPVWQARRAAKGAVGLKEKGKRSANSNGGMKGLNLNVNSCIGYGNQVSCRGDEGGGGGGGINVFKFRGLFSKKVY